jgi:acyl-CoA synthetase (AMP-forming)/AMP-acid ligase II
VPCVFLPTASFVRSPRVWLDAIHKHRGTITYAPNFAYALVAKRLKEKDVAGLDLSCLRIAGCGAEPIQPKALREFADKLAPAGFRREAFVPSYGMAEATLAITFMPRNTGLRTDKVDAKSLGRRVAEPVTTDASATELVDCGVPFPDHEIAIIDETGRRLGEREVGQIIARGPSVSPGYHDEPALTGESFKDGWLHTGDLGYRAGGHLFICGRVKDILIIRGRNYYPQDIEWTVGELPGVRRGNVVAFGVSVDGEEQLVVCAEAFQSEAAGLSEAIASAIAGELGLSVYKVEIVPQGSLPRTSSGKAQRRKAKQMFLEGTLGRARSVQGKEEAPPAGA